MTEERDPETGRRKRRPPLRLTGLPPEEQLALLKAEIEWRRKNEEARLIRTAHRAGYFRRRVTSAQLTRMLTPTEDEPAVTSQLMKLEIRMANVKTKATAEERRLDTRRKILLGAFLIAQAAHKPEIKAMVKAELPGFLNQHRDAKVAANNKALLAEYLE